MLRDARSNPFVQAGCPELPQLLHRRSHPVHTASHFWRPDQHHRLHIVNCSAQSESSFERSCSTRRQAGRIDSARAAAAAEEREPAVTSTASRLHLGVIPTASRGRLDGVDGVERSARRRRGVGSTASTASSGELDGVEGSFDGAVGGPRRRRRSPRRRQGSPRRRRGAPNSRRKRRRASRRPVGAPRRLFGLGAGVRVRRGGFLAFFR